MLKGSPPELTKEQEYKISGKLIKHLHYIKGISKYSSHVLAMGLAC